MNPRECQRATHTQEWAHCAARTLHGWREHKYHTGFTMMLTTEEYKSAVNAACTSSNPHEPALSEHRGKGI